MGLIERYMKRVEAKGDIIVRLPSGIWTTLPVGSNTQVLTADSAQAAGVKWAAASGGATSPLTTKGDIWGYSTADARIPVGADATVLTADSTQALGVKWAAPAASGGYPIPALVQAPVSGYAGAATSVVATLGSTPVNGHYLYALVCSTGRGATSITQTNVTWAQLGTVNGNGQYLEVWKGTVGAAAGTAVTANFTGSNKEQLIVFEMTNSFTTLGSPATATSASATNWQQGALATNPGDYVIAGISGNSPSTDDLKCNMPAYPLNIWGGAGNAVLARSIGGDLYIWGLQSTSVGYKSAAWVIS